MGALAVRNRSWFRDRDPREYSDWYKQQDKDNNWIEENNMATYTQVFEGFLNDNSEGVQKNEKAPKYRSSGSGKSAIVATQDIPAGSVIALAAWGGKGQYGPYIKISGQLVHPDQQQNYQQPVQQAPQQNYQQPPQQAPQQQAAPQQEAPPPFDDDIPF